MNNLNDSTEGATIQAADLLSHADSLIITAGAGMGIDSGMPDFRGPGGFWGVYPALGRARIDFHDIANPYAFQTQPRTAWGFYGHRFNLYRTTVPHEGFNILQRIADRMPFGAFVHFSNCSMLFPNCHRWTGFTCMKLNESH